MNNPKQRFSNRVENYIKFRPGYPLPAIDYLCLVVGINKNSIVADIGSGTGILTKLLLDRVKKILAVEPNKEMREAAEQLLSRYTNFVSINGSAEDTTIPDGTVDCIIAAQAFHWFDREASKKEFRRILKPDGKVVLIWNSRLTDTDFLREYDTMLLHYANDYAEVNHQNVKDVDIGRFLRTFTKVVFPNTQVFNYNELVGRLLSSSYMPSPGEGNYDVIMGEMKRMYNHYAVNDRIEMNYETVMYWGGL